MSIVVGGEVLHRELTQTQSIAMQNPYESPTTESEVVAESRLFPFDIGNVVGRYLQFLAACSVGSMLIDWLVFGEERLDLNFIFYFWGSAALRAHSSVARLWVIGISAVAVVFCIGMMVTAFFVGTEGMSLRLGRRIDNPTFSDVVQVGAIIFALAAFPLGMLLTRQARIEFAKPLRATIGRHKAGTVPPSHPASAKPRSDDSA